MTRLTCAAALAFALLGPALQPTPGSAQPAPNLENSQVDVSYVPPRDPKFQPIYDRLKNLQVLENLRQFLAPLRLPRKLAIRIDQCGAATHSYVPGQGVTICYEFIDEIEQIIPGSNDREGMVAGTFVQVMLYDVSLAVFDLLEVPVWGREHDAADRLAALLMLQFGEDISFKTIVGVANFFIMSKKTWTGSDFADIRSPEAQRFYNYICIAYGGDPRTFSFLVAKDKELLPKDRAERCADEYEQVRTAFYLRIMPHVDPDLLIAVRAKRWPVLQSRK
jgi:hypothetical protein